LPLPTPPFPLPTPISPLQTFVQSTTWKGEPCEAFATPLKKNHVLGSLSIDLES